MEFANIFNKTKAPDVCTPYIKIGTGGWGLGEERIE
jgi:hypothetical protein